ncbi:MAG: hypothetical protein ABW278_00300 [Steroidobacteraceae bacterium]
MKTAIALSAQLQLKLLGAVLEFMNLSGVRESAMRQAFDRGLAEIREKRGGQRGKSDERHAGNINVSAELLRLWHRDGRYINVDAKPRPLSLVKGRNSLSAAIRRLDPTAVPSEILAGMKAVGLIRRTSRGLYLPTSESAIVDQLHPVLVEHVARTVIRLVSTVCRNTDPSGQSLPLIERHAAIPDLNPADRKAFADFTRAQGMAYLESVDDWLQQRRSRRATPARKARKGGVAASVHLVAYLGDEIEQSPRPRAADGARRATAAREARV